MKNPNFENFKNMTREEKIETLFKDPRKQDSASKETRLEEISHPGLKHELLHVGDGFLETKKEAPKEETPKEKFLWDGLSIKKPEEPQKDSKEEGMIWESDAMKKLRLKRPLSPEEQSLHKENERQIKEDQERGKREEILKRIYNEEGFVGIGKNMKKYLADQVEGIHDMEKINDTAPEPPKKEGILKRIWNKLFR